MELIKAVDVKLWPLSGSSNRGREPPTDKILMVSTAQTGPDKLVFRLDAALSRPSFTFCAIGFHSGRPI